MPATAKTLDRSSCPTRAEGPSLPRPRSSGSPSSLRAPLPPPYQLPWDGTPLKRSEVLALDTETTLVDLKAEVPELVLATATDGERLVVIRPDQMAQFMVQHAGTEWVFHNAAFDYWVIWKYL